MALPLAINKEQILDIFFGIWPTMVSSLSTATASSDSIAIYLQH